MSKAASAPTALTEQVATTCPSVWTGKRKDVRGNPGYINVGPL